MNQLPREWWPREPISNPRPPWLRSILRILGISAIIAVAVGASLTAFVMVSPTAQEILLATS
jgi:hypothetical protein